MCNGLADTVMNSGENVTQAVVPAMVNAGLSYASDGLVNIGTVDQAMGTSGDSSGNGWANAAGNSLMGYLNSNHGGDYSSGGYGSDYSGGNFSDTSLGGDYSLSTAGGDGSGGLNSLTPGQSAAGDSSSASDITSPSNYDSSSSGGSSISDNLQNRFQSGLTSGGTGGGMVSDGSNTNAGFNPNWLAMGAAVGGGLLGAASGNGMPNNLTTTQQNNIDPRIAAMLFGNGSDPGLMAKYQSFLDQPQDPSLTRYAQSNDNFLNNNAVPAQNNMYGAANTLMQGSIMAPQANGPSQNGLDLSGSYNQMINGDPAANPYLKGAIQQGINQSQTAFDNLQTDATRNLTENILPNIRGTAMAAGQYGGSRQGIAEGRALNDYSTQMGRAASQVGQNNTDAAVAAQSGQYTAGENRALTAMNSLGANQYGLTGQNLSSQINTNALNSGNIQAGINANNGLLSNAYTVAANNDAYGLNKAGKVNGLLTPYAGLNGSSTTSQPLYQNRMGNILGGVSTGLGLLNQSRGLFSGSGSSSAPSQDYSSPYWADNGYTNNDGSGLDYWGGGS